MLQTDANLSPSLLKRTSTAPCIGDERNSPLAQHILRYINDNLLEPDLSSAKLQSAFHVSRATLYRLLQDRGGVVCYIRERRLAWAHSHLRAHPDCSITWLLYEAGFGSERQFQRAFLARFGMSPIAWRQVCRASSSPGARRD